MRWLNSSVLFFCLLTGCKSFIPTVPACGNGTIEPGELCDDGNQDSGDLCRGDCEGLEVCGDTLIDLNETCDDGNDIDNDGCDSNCTLSACGNQIVNADETCDDGNLVDGDGCDSNCTPTACGNGVSAGLEECDDNNLSNDDGCDSNCTLSGCGNTILNTNEICDDGNLIDGDGCDSNCTPTACGNGVLSPGEFCPTSPTLFQFGDEPIALVVADATGDAIPDVVTANESSDNFSLFVGNGDGTFTTEVTVDLKQRFPNVNAPSAVAVFDFDQSGQPGIVVATQGSQSLLFFHVVLDGLPVFAQEITLGVVPHSLLVSDVNSDSLPDLIVAVELPTSGNDAVLVLLGRTTAPFFESPVTVTTGDNPRGLASADLDGDNLPDLLVANALSSTISVFRNVAGSFSLQTTVPAGNNATALSVGDLDEDGLQDVGVSFPNNRFAVFFGESAFTFLAPVSLSTTPSLTATVATDIKFANVSGDSSLDIVVTEIEDKLTVFTGNGTRVLSITPSSTLIGNEPLRFAVDSIDGNTAPDLITLNHAGDGISVVKNDGAVLSLSIVDFGGDTDRIVAGDLDGIAGVELVTANPSADNVTVLFADTEGLSFSLTYALADVNDVTLADLNQDGAPDIIVAADSVRNLSVIVNNGQLVQQTVQTLDFVSFTPTALRAGDLNGDGRVDLVAVSENVDQVVVMLNNIPSGAQTFSSIDFTVAFLVMSESGTVINDLTLSDINDDGALDIILADLGGDRIRVFLNNGNGVFTSSPLLPTGVEPVSVSSADLDGDGFNDLIALNRGDLLSPPSFQFFSGGQTISAGASFSLGGINTSLFDCSLLPDINNDGFLDILFGDKLLGDIIIMTNDGQGVFTEQNRIITNDQVADLLFVDVDRDTFPDLLVAQSGTDGVVLIRQDP